MKSPVTRAKAVMSRGAVTFTRRRRRRAELAISRPVPPATAGAEGVAVPWARPRIAKRSVMMAISSPVAKSRSSRCTATTRPALDSSRASTQPSTLTRREGCLAASCSRSARKSTVWSRWTAPSRPSISGMPSSTTEPRQAYTTGQHGPSRASGTIAAAERVSGRASAVTAPWS